MSDLEHLGLIYAPHISAGRLPTQRGLRFFVDAFMEVGDLSDEERRVIEAQVRASGSGSSLEHMLTEASQMLSGMSRGAGVVLAAKSEVPLKHIEFIRLEPTKALAVLVVAERRRREPHHRAAGRRHRLATAGSVEFPQCSHPRPHACRSARPISACSRRRPGARSTRCRSELVEQGLAIWSGSEGGRPARLIVRGRANLLEGVTAEADIERLSICSMIWKRRTG